MVDWATIGEIVLAFVGGVVVDRWVWLGREWANWRLERRGTHLEIEPHRSITRVGLSEEVLLRLRIKNKARRTIPVQIAYGDDPNFLSRNPEYLPWRAILEEAAFMVNGTPAVNAGRDLASGDSIEVEMRLKPIAAGKSGLVVSAISRGFEAQWTNAQPFLVEIVGEPYTSTG